MIPGNRAALVLLGLAVSFVCSTHAYSSPRVNTLKGLEGIEVLVEEFKPEVEDFITVLQVQTDTELKLRDAGIRIFTKEENEKAHPQRKPYLYIKITSYKIPVKKDILPFNVEMSLKQKVQLQGCPEFSDQSFFSPTWYRNSVSIVSWKNPTEIRDVISELTDTFIKAYLKAGGKPK